MKRSAPLLSLAAVAVLGLALLAVNVVNTPQPTPTPAAAAAPIAAASTTEAAPTTAAPPAVAQKVYAGRSTGREVTVAIAVKDGRAVAYVCDGKKIEAWLDGTLVGDQLSLKGPDGAAIDGTVDETSAKGTVAAGGKSWPYAAKAVQAPEGLYEGRSDVRGVASRIGWIVVDGTETGLLRRGDELLAPPPLQPAGPDGVEIDGQPVTVRSGLDLVAS